MTRNEAPILSLVLHAALAAWVALLPVLVLQLAQAEDGYGLDRTQTCTVDAAQLRSCLTSCEADVALPVELPEDGPIEVECTLRLATPQLAIFSPVELEWSPLLLATPAVAADAIGRPGHRQRPPTPPPERFTHT